MPYDLPADARASLEAAFVEAEVALRRKAKRFKDTHWPGRQAAVLKVMSAAFVPFSAIAYSAISENRSTILDARADATNYLERHAYQAHDLLQRAGIIGWSGPTFEHGPDSRDAFCYDVVKAFQESRFWADFLQTLSVSPPSGGTQPANTDEHPLAGRVRQFKARVFRETGSLVTNKMIWQVAGYHQKSEFYRFQRGSGTPTVKTKFEGVLRKRSREFLRLFATISQVT